jgi:hypothetical protein
MSNENTVEYQRGTASATQLQEEIQAFWAELATDEDLQGEVRDAGLDPAEVEKLDTSQAIEVTQEGEGIDPLTVTIIVALAPSAVHVLDSLWDEVIVPWIRRRRGADALGKKKDKKKRDG